MTPLLPGDPRQLGDYWPAGRLGVGGQGVVYDAYDISGQRVAIKVLHAEFLEHGGARAGFAKEVTAARTVAPFCTARIIDVELDGPRPYIVSEYIEGPSLQQAVDRHGPYDADRLHRLAVGIATALAAIHDAEVMHRDLKPANVLLGPDGPRVIDFGIARTKEMTFTDEEGVAAGTPRYMAPERLSGGRGGAPVDVWAWGAVMMFAATGRPPFGGENTAVLRHQILNTRPDFTVLREPLRHLVTVAMSHDPAARPSAQSLLLALVGGRDELPRLLESGSAAARMTGAAAGAAVPSLGVLAENAYNALHPDDRDTVPATLLRLILPNRTAEATLREAAHHDLVGNAPDPARVDRVLRAFTDNGLLTRQGGSITLTSAALLRAWPRLRGWVEDDGAGLQVQAALNQAARVWHAKGRQQDDLYQGSALREALGWAANGRHHLELDKLERAFLDASDVRTRARARRGRAIRGVLAGLVAVLLVTVGAVVLQTVRDRQRQVIAAAARAVARAEAMRSADPLTAALLSVAAWRVRPSFETEAAMQTSLLQRERAVFRPAALTGDARYDLGDEGRTLAVVDRGQATLWDVSTGVRVRVIEGVTGAVNAVALSADDRRLAVAGPESIRLWDTERSELVATLGQGAQRVAFSPRRLLLVATGMRGEGQVWDLTSEERLPIDIPRVRLVTVSADDAVIAAVLPQGQYELWDWQRRLARRPGEFAALGADRHALAVGRAGDVRLTDPSRGADDGPLLKGLDARAIRFSGDGRFLAAYDGSSVSLWSARGKRLFSRPVKGVVDGLRLGRTGATLSYSLLGGTVVSQDVRDLTQPRKLANEAETGLIDPRSPLVIVQGDEVELWDGAGPAKRETLSTGRSSPTTLALSPDGKVLAVGTAAPAAVTLWDTATGERERTFTVTGATEVGGLAFSPDGKKLAVAPFEETVTATAGNWRDVRVWDVARRTWAESLRTAGGSLLVFRPDGEELAVNGTGNALVEMGTGRVISQPFGETVDGVRAIAFSPDSTRMATSALDTGVTLWDTATHRPLGNLPIPARGFGEVELLAFAPDGRTLAVAGDRSVQLWNVVERKPLGPPSTYGGGQPVTLAFDAHGQRLRSLRTDGTIDARAVEPRTVAAELCARAGRSLSADEWERLIPGVPYQKVC